jgi:site-specific DNA recombinase
MNEKRAVIYARVSTDEQASNYSLPTQLDACRKYAEKAGMVIVGEFSDDYSGATPIEARPEGRKAFTLLKSGEADCLIAYAVDRLVRPPEDGDEWDTPILIRSLAKLGKELHTVDRGQLKTDLGGLLIAVLDSKSAGDERRKIIERTSRGRNGKAASGMIVGGGQPPYGYSYTYSEIFNPKTKKTRKIVTGLQVKDTEADVIEMIFRWCATGETVYLITKKLSDMGIPTPGEGKNRPRKRASGLWRQSTVYNILTRETYIGHWRWGLRAGANGKMGMRPIEDTTVVQVPAIIDSATWKLAQERLEYNKKMALRNAPPRLYLIRGMVECNCSRCMVGSADNRAKNGHKYYYQCSARCNLYSHEAAFCNLKVRGDVLDYAAWEYLLDVMTDEKELEAKLREAQRLDAESKQPKRDELTLVLDAIAEAEAEAGEIALAFRNAKGAVAASLERQQDNVNAKYERACKRRDELQAEIEANSITDQEIENALNFRRDVANGLKNPTWDDKRAYLEMMRFHVKVLDKHHAKMTCYLDTQGHTIDLPEPGSIATNTSTRLR